MDTTIKMVKVQHIVKNFLSLSATSELQGWRFKTQLTNCRYEELKVVL